MSAPAQALYPPEGVFPMISAGNIPDRTIKVRVERSGAGKG
jgi:hypothetical protein